jgi:uncharacterized membrane protein
MPFMARCVIGLVVGGGLAVVFASAAQASIGVGVQADPVRLATAAHPGGSYTLPSLYVVNTGSEAESVTVTVKHLSAGPGMTIPASWVHATAPSGQLQPKQQVLIPLKLSTPGNAKPGSYRSDIVVTGTDGSTGQGQGVQFGAAAATDLEFTITPGPAASSWLGLAPWKWWMIAVLAMVGAVTFVVRRSGLRIRIERQGIERSESLGGHHGA